MKVKLYPKLTDKVFGNKTYSDIFAGKHNIMPYGDMSQGLKWCDTRGNVEISDERFISGNFSAMFCGHESALAARDSRKELPNYNCASFDISKSKVLFSQNSEESIFTASIIKLLSVLVAVDYIQDLNCEYVVQSRDVASGSGNVFKPGDVVKIKDLLYAALLPSSNTATNCIAQIVGDVIAQGKDEGHPKRL